MKKIGIILLLTAMVFQGFSQEVSEKELNNKESLENGTKVNFERYNVENHRDEDDNKDSHERNARRFKGHWAGAEFGFNNYNHITNMNLPESISYMSLHSGKSNSFNINFSQISLGIFRHFGIVSGVGLNWNNYVFSGNNNIQVGDNGVIEELIPVETVPLKKSKFTTLYLNIPAILELQLPTGEGHRLNIGAGVIGGIKLGSHTKMIYGTYYLTPWFQKGKGPGYYALEPFEIGLAFTFND